MLLRSFPSLAILRPAALTLGCLLAGCAGLKLPFSHASDAHGAPEPAVTVAPLTPPPGARTAEAFDTTTAAQRRAAVKAPGGADRLLGRTVVSLGSPADPGFWIATSLVGAPGKGRVVAGGASVAVELRPLPEGGSRMSLAAFRALGLPLTDLAEVAVHAD